MRVGDGVLRYSQSDHGYQPQFLVADKLTLWEEYQLIVTMEVVRRLKRHDSQRKCTNPSTIDMAPARNMMIAAKKPVKRSTPSPKSLSPGLGGWKAA